MKKQAILVLSFVALTFVPALGRQTEAERVQQERERQPLEIRRQEQQRELENRSAKVFRDESLRRGVYKPRLPQEEPISAEELEKVKLLLTPNQEDSAKYEDFLSQPKTGLFRLFPDFGCNSKLIVKVDGDCAEAIPYGWSYSFRQKDYAYNFLFDIRLKDGNLISDSFHSQGILVDLGDSPLNEISTADDRMKFLIEFKPETGIDEARNQFLEIEKGITFADRVYTKSVKAKENTTYAARFIAYKKQHLPSRKITGSSNNVARYISMGYDERVDLTIAFRIIRNEKDGGITILWKELNRQKSPKVIFGKDYQLADIKPEN